MTCETWYRLSAARADAVFAITVEEVGKALEFTVVLPRVAVEPKPTRERACEIISSAFEPGSMLAGVPTRVEAILDQITGLRQQFLEFRESLNGRFDEGDYRLNNIYSDISSQLSLTDVRLGELLGNMDQIRAILYDLQRGLNRLHGL